MEIAVLKRHRLAPLRRLRAAFHQEKRAIRLKVPIKIMLKRSSLRIIYQRTLGINIARILVVCHYVHTLRQLTVINERMHPHEVGCYRYFGSYGSYYLCLKLIPIPYLPIHEAYPVEHHAVQSGICGIDFIPIRELMTPKRAPPGVI